MTSDLFPQESQAEFKALAEHFKIKAKIKTLEGEGGEEEEKFGLPQSGNDS